MNELIARKRQAQQEGWLSWVRTTADELALRNGCWFEEARAERVAEFFCTFLCHSKGRWAGKPFELLDWQWLDIIGPLFGWIREDEFGQVVRRFQKAYVEIPKKNGKSSLAAGIGLYMLVGDGEQGAEVYTAAVDRPQALIVHREAVNMVKASPELKAALDINRGTFTISDEETQSFYRALSGDPKANEGWNPHCIIADELHKWHGRELYDALRWGAAARSQPLMFQITTAGDNPQSVCRREHDYAVGCNEGKIRDDQFLGVIYAAHPDDDPWSEPTWRKANPSLGSTIPVESFRNAANEAMAKPSDWAAFKRYRLNIWTTGDNPWIRESDWNACRVEFTAEDLLGEPCYGGLDLARVLDTCSLQLLFPREDGRYRLLSYFWLPRATAEENAHLIDWLPWAEAGHIELVPGDVMQFKFIEEKYAELAEMFEIRELAFDPHKAEDVTQRMEERTEVPRIAYKQSAVYFAAPVDEFERLILGRKIEHAGNPVMNWQIGNAVLTSDTNGNHRIKKPKPDDRRKVDGPVAGLMALGRAMLAEAENGPSPYESEDPADYEIFL